MAPTLDNSEKRPSRPRKDRSGGKIQRGTVRLSALVGATLGNVPVSSIVTLTSMPRLLARSSARQSNREDLPSRTGIAVEHHAGAPNEGVGVQAEGYMNA